MEKMFPDFRKVQIEQQADLKAISNLYHKFFEHVKLDAKIEELKIVQENTKYMSV